MLFLCSQAVLWLFNAHFCQVMQSDLCASFVAENVIESHQCLENRLQVTVGNIPRMVTVLCCA